jgi:Tfp pilus assembly protein PilO
MNRSFSIIINFLIILIVSYYWIFPQYKEVRGVSQELNNKRNELKQKEDYFSKIEKTIEALEAYERELTKIQAALPKEPFLPSLLNIIERTATENGLLIKELGEFKINDFDRSLKEINLKIAMVGSYPALKNFLSALERNARFIKVTNISFTTPKEKEPFNFSLEIKAYSY